MACTSHRVFFWLTTSFIWHILPSIPIWQISRFIVSFLPSTFPSFFSPALSIDALEYGIASVLFLLTEVAFFALTCRAITADVSLPFYSRPLRNAFKSAVNALLTPSELAYFLKFLTSPLIRGVVVCEIFCEFILQLVYQPLYVRLGALEYPLLGLNFIAKRSRRAFR